MRNKLKDVLSVLALSILLVAVVGGLVWGFLYLSKMESKTTQNPVQDSKTEQVNEDDEREWLIGGDEDNNSNGKEDDSSSNGNAGDSASEKKIESVKYLWNANAFTYKKNGSAEEYFVTGIKDADVYYENIILPTETPEGGKVVGISNGAFSSTKNDYCKAIKKVVVPSIYKSIGVGAFEGSNIEEVSIGLIIKGSTEDGSKLHYAKPTVDGKMVICKNAFKDCKNLKNVEMYKAVSGVSVNAFTGSENIESISIETESALEDLNKNIFGSETQTTVTIYVRKSIDGGDNEVLNYRFMKDEKTIKRGSVEFNVWKSKGIFYTIIVDANGGSTSKTVYEVGSNENFTPEVCVKEHYLFCGFTLENGKNVGTTIHKGQITESQKIVARYSPILYKVNYNLDGGENSEDNIKYISATISGGYFALNDAQKEGFEFAGWYFDSKYTIKATTISVKNLVEDENGNLCINLYAKFVEA